MEPTRIENGKPLLIAGLQSHYGGADMQNIPAQWQRFVSYLGKIPGQVGRLTYAVVTGGNDAAGVDYLTGVKVSNLGELPAELTYISLPAQRYAVFKHRGHISKIKDTIAGVCQDGLKAAGYSAPNPPVMLEVYGEAFDPNTGSGEVELWFAVK